MRKPLSFRQARERIQAATEQPVFTPEQTNLFYSGYVNSLDSALGALESSSNPELHLEDEKYEDE